MRLDRFAEGKPEHRGGKESDHEVRGEALRRTVREDAPQHGCELRPELPADGEDRAGLDHDLERLRLFAGVAEQRPGDDQVAGRGDGEELGQALDDAEDERGEEGGLIQARASDAKRPGECSHPAREL